MKAALVHDYLNQYGGAERVLEIFCRIFPKAPIYTLLCDNRKTGSAFRGRRICTSFLQRIPLVKSHHRSFLMLMPLAVEQFDLSEYDLVLSDSASYAKGVITRPDALHICYCHTPIRYAWDDSQRYIREFGYAGIVRKFIPFGLNYIRFWDEKAAQRVDKFIANSHLVAERIRKYYHRGAKVIYPSVNTGLFCLADKPQDYFLLVGRLLPDKHFDYVINAFNQLGWPLKIVGAGPERKKLEKIAGSNVEFAGLVSEVELRECYARCRAFIFPQEADFGIAGVEAMAAGRPVIAYRIGGALEIVEEGVTGLFYDEQTSVCLIDALRRFEQSSFDTYLIREKSKRFDDSVFEAKIKAYISKAAGQEIR